MRKFIKKRYALGALGLLVVAGAAFAYFTTSGEGTGEATVGSASQEITVSGTLVPNLYPRLTAPDPNTTIKVENKSKGSVDIKEVLVKSITVDSAHEAAHCESTWFHASGAIFNEPIEAEEEASKLGTVWLEDSGTNQNACKGATVTVNYEAVSKP